MRRTHSSRPDSASPRGCSENHLPEVSRGRYRADKAHIRSAPSFPAAGSWESWLIRKIVVLVAVALPVGCTSLFSPSPAFSTRTTSPNLLTGDSAGFDNGTGTWGAATTGASLARATSPAQAGAGSLGVTTNAQGPLDIYIGSGKDAATWTAATPGARYTITGFVRAGSISRTVDAVEAFYDATGKQVASLFGRPVTDSSGGWTPTNPVVGIAPPTAAYVVFGLVFYGTATGEVHYVDSASLTSVTVTPVALHGPFHTQGNAIYGSDGARVIFRGIHRVGSDNPIPSFPSDAEIAQARAWDANVVRVPLNESLWVNTCPGTPTNKATYPTQVDAEVSSITSRGMLALLDLHVSVTSDCGPGDRQAMADATYAPAFWSQVAARYKTNPMVAFELYNEPHNVSDAVWLNGGATTDNSITFKATGMQQLYDAVRAAGANNLVFIDGKDYAVRPAETLVNGVNIVNAAHDYMCGDAPPPVCKTPQPYNANIILNNWTKVGSSQPVMLTEFGWPDKNDGTFNANVVNAAEARGWGWIAFAWDGTTYGLFGLITVSGTTFEPSPAGMPIVAGLTYNGTGGARGAASATTQDTRYTLSAMRIAGPSDRRAAVDAARSARTLS